MICQRITRDLILWKQKQQPEPTCELDMIWVWFASLEACICSRDPALTKKYIVDSFFVLRRTREKKMWKLRNWANGWQPVLRKAVEESTGEIYKQVVGLLIETH